MQVLVVESHEGAAERLERALCERGHVVHRCHEERHERTGCRALDAEDGCPLDRQRIDVAVDVRRTHHPAPRPLEQGATCAIRARVPMVLAGVATDSRLERWATSVAVGDVPAVVKAIEAVDGSISPMHQQVVDEALATLAPDGDTSAVVRRRPGQVLVELVLPPEVTAAEGERLAVRLVAAVRRFDPVTAIVDVSRTS
jgi:hypothetical protein